VTPSEFLEAKRSDPSWFTCNRLHCFMSRQSCATRYHNANHVKWTSGQFKTGFGDAACEGCSVGKKHLNKNTPSSTRLKYRTPARLLRCTVCDAPAKYHKCMSFNHPVCEIHYKRIASRIHKKGTPYKKDGTL